MKPKKKLFKKFIIIFLIIAVCSALYYANSKIGAKRSASEITTAKVEKGPIVQTIEATGTLVPANKLKVRSEVEGNLQEKKYKDGNQVKQGDILLEVDKEKLKKDVLNSDIKLKRLQNNLRNMMENTGPYDESQVKNNLVKSKIALDYAEKNLASTERIFKQEIVTRRQFEEAQRNLETSKLDYQVAQQQVEYNRQKFQKDVSEAKGEIRMAEEDLKESQTKLEKASIRAPISGSIVEDILKEKKYVGSGEEVLSIGDLSQFQAKVNVDELDIGKVKLDQPVTITSEGFKGVKLPGHVVEIASQATRSTFAEVEVTVQIDSTMNQSIRPNLSVDAEFQTQKKEGVLKVPLEAVIKQDSTSHVFVVVNNHAKKREVTVGTANPESIVIEKGLKEGEVVAVQGAIKLKDNEMVTIKPVKADKK